MARAQKRERTGSWFTSRRGSKSMVSLSERVSRIDSFHTEWRDGSGAQAQTRDTPGGGACGGGGQRLACLVDPSIV